MAASQFFLVLITVQFSWHSFAQDLAAFPPTPLQRTLAQGLLGFDGDVDVDESDDSEDEPSNDLSDFTLTPLQQFLVEGFVGFDPSDTVVIDFRSMKKTWCCHWFPWQERQSGGDPVNNLFAEGGPLDKLDRITGGNAREYEYENNRVAKDKGEDFAWWGYCDRAATVASLLEQPKKSVVLLDKHGQPITFTRNDIQGLLVSISNHLVGKTYFCGNRYRDASADDHIAPEIFIETIKRWAQEDIPLVLDIDRGQQVWNFPYDKVRIVEVKTAPSRFNDAECLNSDVTHYKIEMSGTGYENTRRNYSCWIRHNQWGQVVSSGWTSPNNNQFAFMCRPDKPDFMWRPNPIGDLHDRHSWRKTSDLGVLSNPHVDPNIVYEIYAKSL